MNQKIRYLLLGCLAVVALAAAFFAGLVFAGKDAPRSRRIGRLYSVIQVVAGMGRSAADGDVAFLLVEVDTSNADAEACLVFTRRLDNSGKAQYQDFLALDPAIKV